MMFYRNPVLFLTLVLSLEYETSASPVPLSHNNLDDLTEYHVGSWDHPLHIHPRGQLKVGLRPSYGGGRQPPPPPRKSGSRGGGHGWPDNPGSGW
ncbi:hypothetical protein C8Q75DRAFT_804692 [Abortiporus biennis]|nr:hypothetical protein C8Q75DRAFT_804692 [Abortiporus biennis]